MSEQIIIVPQEIVRIVEVAPQGVTGPQGPPGVSGGDTENVTVTKTAGHPVNPYLAVCSDASGRAVYASSDNPDTGHRILGITTQAAAVGSPVQIKETGEIENPAWDWNVLNPVFLGISGQLTQTRAVSGYHIAMGFPVTAQILRVQIGVPVFFGEE